MITKNIDLAVNAILEENVIGMPTETVYGLAGSIYSEKALQKIFELKQRPNSNPLIVHIAEMNQLNEIASQVPTKAKILAQTFWPGPLTLILPKKSTISNLITAGNETVAVRIPNHPVALDLLRKVKVPLAAPSANPFTGISPTRSKHVQNYFSDGLSVILEGGICNRGVESTIVGFEGDEIILYRHGAISIEELEKVVGKIETKTTSEKGKKTTAPGMHIKHYAPKTKTIVTKNPENYFYQNPDKKIGYIALRKYHPEHSRQYQIVLSWKGDLKEAVSRFYDSLHFLDAQNLDFILVKPFPNRGLGRTLNDRLNRASAAS